MAKGNQEINLKSVVGDKVTYHLNIDQHLLMVFEDKVRLTLIEYEKQFQIEHDWKTPLSILATIVVAILTTNFIDVFFIPASTIRALAYFFAIYFAYQTIRNYMGARKKKNLEYTIEKVVEALRESSEKNLSNTQE